MRRWTVRTHLAGLFALAAAACARGERAPAAGPAVIDDADRRVTLAAPARRIVSLLPSFTEMLFAIGAGDRLVGRTAWCDYPPAALAVPSVGDGIPPNVEAVAARRLGVLTGRRAAGDSLARAMDSLVFQRPESPTPGPKSLAFIVWDNPPIVIGAGSFLDRLAGLAGAHNVFHDIATPSAQVSIETIAARNPDFIAVLSDTAAPPRYAGRPEWRVVPAVRKGRFLVLPGELFGRPGPRAAEAVRELRRRLETTP